MRVNPFPKFRIPSGIVDKRGELTKLIFIRLELEKILIYDVI